MFRNNETKTAKHNPRRSNSILWVEATAFGTIIIFSWLTEIFRFPHLLWGEPFTSNYSRAILRTVVLGAIWLWVHMSTRQLLKRLHYLEEFLRICSWCRKVNHEGKWLETEKYFNSKFSTKTSHGMCPDCLQKKKEEIAAHEKQPSGSSELTEPV